MNTLTRRTNQLPTNYQHFEKAELRRDEGGKFEPASAEPRTIEDMVTYGRLQQAADSANGLMDMVQNRADLYTALDGKKEDFNSQPGVVAVQDLAHVYLKGPKTPTRQTLLNYNPDSKEPTQLDQRVDGDYEDFHLKETVNATFKDGLNVQYEQLITRDGETKSISFLLSEQANGNFSYEVNPRPLPERSEPKMTEPKTKEPMPSGRYLSMGGTSMP